jgi:hypothetical protein
MNISNENFAHRGFNQSYSNRYRNMLLHMTKFVLLSLAILFISCHSMIKQRSEGLHGKDLGANSDDQIIDKISTPCFSLDTNTAFPIYLNDTIKGLIVIQCNIDTTKLILSFSKIITIRLTDIKNNKSFDLLDDKRIEKDSIYFKNIFADLIKKTKRHIEELKLVRSSYSECDKSNRLIVGFKISNI